MSKFLFVLKVLFGLAIFVGGTWLTIMLVIDGLYMWSGLSGFIAIIGAIIPFLGNNKGTKENFAEPAFSPSRPAPTETSEAATSVPQQSGIPEDSMLRRHYLTHLQSLKELENTPAPVKAAPPELSVPAPVSEASAPEPQMLTSPPPIPQATEKPSVQLPEDSMLRRHYLTHVRSLIAAELPPRPTDSSLKRHYDALLASKTEEFLQGC